MYSFAFNGQGSELLLLYALLHTSSVPSSSSLSATFLSFHWLGKSVALKFHSFLGNLCACSS